MTKAYNVMKLFVKIGYVNQSLATGEYYVDVRGKNYTFSNKDELEMWALGNNFVLR